MSWQQNGYVYLSTVQAIDRAVVMELDGDVYLSAVQVIVGAVVMATGWGDVYHSRS